MCRYDSHKWRGNALSCNIGDLETESIIICSTARLQETSVAVFISMVDLHPTSKLLRYAILVLIIIFCGYCPGHHRILQYAIFYALIASMDATIPATISYREDNILTQLCVPRNDLEKGVSQKLSSRYKLRAFESIASLLEWF